MNAPEKRYSNWGDNFFQDLFGLPFEKRHSDLMKTDVKEVDKNYELTIELPGFEKENINVTLEDGYLTVEAKKEQRNDEHDNKGKYVRRERYLGSCSRSYYVGDIKEDNIKAKYDKGILTLIFPTEEVKTLEEKKKIAID